MKGWKEITYPKMLVSLAEELSVIRSNLSKKVYKKGTDKYRGDKEKDISKLGLLAELIIRHYLTEKGYTFESAILIDKKPVVRADITLQVLNDTYLIDVKGVKKEDDTLRVNYNSHNNSTKKITHYLFVHIQSSTKANYKWFTREEVDKWEVVKARYTEVYSSLIMPTMNFPFEG
tara:strand:+ start:583 stop:1107 length:525 start_codon:yes stop_codon:yes gene_type:complete